MHRREVINNWWNGTFRALEFSPLLKLWLRYLRELFMVPCFIPILWPLHEKSWLIGKDPDAGRDCGQEEKGTTEDEMAGWHHRLDGRESEWTPGVGDGQGGLACCNSWGRKESDTTERLNWTELNCNISRKILLGVLWVQNLIYITFEENRNLYNMKSEVTNMIYSSNYLGLL